MIILLSPAKKLDFSPTPQVTKKSKPILLHRTEQLAQVTAKLSPGRLKSLLNLSNDLTQLNWARFQAFDANSSQGLQAGFAFDGEVYRGLDARSLSSGELTWAQSHLRILSGLYGILRPLDGIQPYRLEMGTRLATAQGATLYDFWGDDIINKIREDLSDHHEQTVVNLASNEYNKAAKLKTLDAKIVNVDFKEERNGALRTLMVFAKKARGLMARWIIQNRIEKHQDLSGFNLAGYQYDHNGSTKDRFLFTRPQPERKF